MMRGVARAYVKSDITRTMIFWNLLERWKKVICSEVIEVGTVNRSSLNNEYYVGLYAVFRGTCYHFRFLFWERTKQAFNIQQLLLHVLIVCVTNLPVLNV